MARVLKKTDKKENPGLSKLPKGVRNKMGYMKEGGEMPATGGDRYSRKRKRKARRQRRGKKQRGSCRGGSCPSFKHGGKMKCTC